MYDVLLSIVIIESTSLSIECFLKSVEYSLDSLEINLFCVNSPFFKKVCYFVVTF